MVGIIRVFGFLSIIVSAFLILISFGTIVLLPTLLPLGASALLGGALLVAFARVVELLEDLNRKLGPVHALAVALEQKYRQPNDAPRSESGGIPFDPKNPISDRMSDLPSGSRVERHFRRRVAFLPDGAVLGETDSGIQDFKSFDEWRRAIGQ